MLIGNGMFLCGAGLAFSIGYPCELLKPGAPCPGGARIELLVTLGRGGVGGGTAAGAVADLVDALAIDVDDEEDGDNPDGGPLC